MRNIYQKIDVERTLPTVDTMLSWQKKRILLNLDRNINNAVLVYSLVFPIGARKYFLMKKFFLMTHGFVCLSANSHL